MRKINIRYRTNRGAKGKLKRIIEALEKML
ncbi:hypothetical protein CLPUN_19440 [Clostridium puniceum]|uniref:Uncharacterized protein n=1 Tax=Clostridium puniceum TaxID=29367 RepID=A0A1S8TLN3_9CLOT|nr:hypothetical protein CLPUN_19440 [Clostridium puniceum]